MQQLFLSVKLPSEDTRVGCGVALHGSLIFNVQIIVMYLIHDTEGGSRGPVVKVLDYKLFVVVSSRPPLVGTVRFRSLGNFVYLTLPQSTQLQMGTNTVWKVPAMD